MSRAFWLGIVLLVTACETDSTETGVAFVDWLDLQDQGTRQDCRCFWQDYDYPSEIACLSAELNGVSAAGASCVYDFGDLYPKWEDRFVCLRIAASQQTLCYSQYTNACNGAGFDQCDAQYDVDFGACPHPCDGLSGAALTDCQNEQSKLLADFGSCSGF